MDSEYSFEKEERKKTNTITIENNVNAGKNNILCKSLPSKRFAELANNK